MIRNLIFRSALYSIFNRTLLSFNAFESSTAAGQESSGIIKTKVSGTAFSLDIAALTSTNAVSTNFTGTVKVELVDSSSGNTCSAWPTIQTLANQTFSSAENGRHTVPSITEANAWKNARVRISYPVTSPTIIKCSLDNFAIRPSTLIVAITDQDWQTTGTGRALANTTLPGGAVHKAGQPFTMTVTGLNAAGAIATNYSGSPIATISQCGTGTEVCPVTTSLGSIGLGAWNASAGVITTTATYSDVGAFAVVLQDQHFADVDLNDSSTTERYITSAPVNVGRFVPDHFTVTAGTITARTDLAACASSTFSYMNEPFSITFRLTAQNAAPTNGTTSNYTGGLATLNPANADFLTFGAVDPSCPTAFVAPISAISTANPGRVTTGTPHRLTTGGQVYISGVNGMTAINNRLYAVTVIDANNFTIGADTTGYGTYASGGNASRLSVSAGSGTWSAGIVNVSTTIALQRAAQPDGPFNNATIGIAPQDADGVQALSTSFNLDADNNGTNERVSIGSTQLRFGKIVMKNAGGSELLDLPVPIQTQYWNGSYFLTNAQDTCTSISSASNVVFGNFQGGVNSGNVVSPNNVTLGGVFVAGIGKLTLLKPTPQPTAKGSVDVTLDLDAENKTYLQGNGSGTTYNQNPTMRATFGIYKGGPIIYMREMY